MVRKIYIFLSVVFFLTCIIVLSIIDKTNNIKLSLIIQILIILYLIRITWGCVLYIKKQYQNKKYSYSIILNLGLVIFLVINVLRHINLLVIDWNLTNINNLYNNTLNSFSYFASLVLPLLVIIAFYSIFTNIFLILKEGFSFQNILGILLGIFIVISCLLSQHIFVIFNNFELLNEKIYIKKFIDIALNSVLCYFYCIALATLYCNLIAGKHNPNYDKDFVIILGSQIRKDGTLTPLLKARVDKALEFANNQKKYNDKTIIFIPSGGKGEDEVISEAEAMKQYLLSKGINNNDIIIENESKNTLQNIIFSKNKIDKINSKGKIIFSTTNYHVFRAGVIANNAGIDCEGIGCKTKWYFYVNALIREFAANILSQKRKHLALISLINITMFILVIIGYNYNLI